MFSIQQKVYAITRGRMLWVFLFMSAGSISWADNYQCPSGSFASIYENKIYQVRHVTCLKKVKKKYLRHGPVSQYDFNGKLLQQKFFYNDKPSTAEAFKREMPSSMIAKERTPIPLALWENKAIRIYLRHPAKYEIKNSDSRILNLYYDDKVKALILTGAKRGQTRVEIMSEEGVAVERFDVQVHPMTQKSAEIHSGREEQIYFYSALKNGELLVRSQSVAAVIMDDSIVKAEVWDPSVALLLNATPIMRVQALKEGATHVRIHLFNHKEFKRLEIKVVK